MGNAGCSPYMLVETDESRRRVHILLQDDGEVEWATSDGSRVMVPPKNSKSRDRELKVKREVSG